MSDIGYPGSGHTGVIRHRCKACGESWVGTHVCPPLPPAPGSCEEWRERLLALVREQAADPDLWLTSRSRDDLQQALRALHAAIEAP